ncbi:MAG TPA: YceI family protein [Bdellovibrio sp.]
MKSFAALISLLLAVTTASAEAPQKAAAPVVEKAVAQDTLKSVAGAGKLEFLAIGKPAMIRIKGEGPAPTGEVTVKDGKASGEFKLALNSLNTGIEMRDSHMKEKYLETAKHPEAVLKISDLEIKDIKSGKDTPFTGTLNLHGVEKPVSGTFTNEGTATEQKVKATFKVKISDHTIEIPSYAGIKVADEVEVKIEAELKK